MRGSSSYHSPAQERNKGDTRHVVHPRRADVIHNVHHADLSVLLDTGVRAAGSRHQRQESVRRHQLLQHTAADHDRFLPARLAPYSTVTVLR